MGRPRKTGRRRTARKSKSGRRCKGIRRTSKKTHSAYNIPKAFACAGMRGPATSVITTNGGYVMPPSFSDALNRNPNLFNIRVSAPMKTTNSMFSALAAANRNMYGHIGNVLGKTTNGGWSKQQVDDQQSSGLGFGPRPFRTG